MGELGDTILEREFQAVDADGNQSIIKLRVGLPYLSDDTTEIEWWRCDYQITGIGSEKVRCAHGIDALDALLMCIRLADVFMRNYQKTKTITWLGEEDLGLIPPPAEELTEEERKTMWQDEENPFKQVFDEFFRNFRANRKPPQKPDQTE